MQDLAFEQLALAERLLPASLELDAALNPPHALAHPARIGPLIGDAPLDLVVVQQLAPLDIDSDHLARPEPPGFDDLGGVEVDQPDLRSHHDQPVAGDLVARRAQAVAIHRRADHAAVGKGDRGRPIPRLRQAGVVLVEAAQARINVRHLLPGLGHEHHHRVQRAAPGGDQQVQRLIEGQRVGAALADHRVQFGDGLAPHIGLQRGAAREHPVAVAQQRVDLTVMCDRPERLRDPPVGQRVGRVALVKERQRGGGARIGQIRVEAAQLRRDHQPLVDDRARGERDDVGLADVIGGIALNDGADFGLGAPPREIEQTLEIGLRELLGAPHDDLLNLG